MTMNKILINMIKQERFYSESKLNNILANHSNEKLKIKLDEYLDELFIIQEIELDRITDKKYGVYNGKAM